MIAHPALVQLLCLKLQMGSLHIFIILWDHGLFLGFENRVPLINAKVCVSGVASSTSIDEQLQ